MEKIDLIISCLAREIKNKNTVFLGVCSPIPLLAIGLAKKTHAPNLRYINSLGAVNPEIKFSISSETIDCLNTDKFISLPEVYELAQKGNLDITFFSGAQADRLGNINLSVIGSYDNPKVRLPGPAGSPVLIRLAKKSIILCLNHDKRHLVEKVDFITANGEYDDSRLGRPEKIITSKCIFRLEKDKVVLESIHPGENIEDIKENTGFEFEIPYKLKTTEDISEKELNALNEINPGKRRYELK
ncbi:CoA-transferase [Candidatus Woesearchaeota archaeon]|nr:CoA-transferase [Candidatus Woesearchaeota archaeon]